MFIEFENGWEGVWLAYGTAGVLLLDTTICLLCTLIALLLICMVLKALKLEEAHTKFQTFVFDFFCVQIVKSIIITDVICAVVTFIAYVLKGGSLNVWPYMMLLEIE